MALDTDKTIENVKNFFKDDYATALNVALMKPKDVLNFQFKEADLKNSLFAKAIDTINKINAAYDRLLAKEDREVIREIYIYGKSDQHLIKKFGVGRTKYYIVIKPEALLHFAAAFDNGRLLAAKKVNAIE